MKEDRISATQHRALTKRMKKYYPAHIALVSGLSMSQLRRLKERKTSTPEWMHRILVEAMDKLDKQYDEVLENNAKILHRKIKEAAKLKVYPATEEKEASK